MACATSGLRNILQGSGLCNILQGAKTAAGATGAGVERVAGKGAAGVPTLPRPTRILVDRIIVRRALHGTISSPPSINSIFHQGFRPTATSLSLTGYSSEVFQCEAARQSLQIPSTGVSAHLGPALTKDR